MHYPGHLSIVPDQPGTVPEEGEIYASTKAKNGQIPHQTKAGSRCPCHAGNEQLFKVR